MHRREFLTSAAQLAAIGSLTQGVAAQSAEGTGMKKKLQRLLDQSLSSARASKFQLDYAPHFGMFQKHASSLEDEIRVIADFGFKAIEDNGLRGRSKEEQEKIAKVLTQHGIRMGVFVANDGGFGPLLPRGDKESIERFVKNIQESVEVAKRVNAHWMTVVPGILEERLPMGIQTANVVEGLRRGADIFEKHGLVMVCEPLNWRDHPRLFLRYSDHAYEIMKAVKSPACKILFDMYHQQVSEGNLIDNIDKCWDEIAYFQVGDNPGRCEPGTGEVNYRNVFRHIARKGFQGVLGMEHGNSQGGKEGELAVVKSYRDADSFER